MTTKYMICDNSCNNYIFLEKDKAKCNYAETQGYLNIPVQKGDICRFPFLKKQNKLQKMNLSSK